MVCRRWTWDNTPSMVNGHPYPPELARAAIERANRESRQSCSGLQLHGFIQENLVVRDLHLLKNVTQTKVVSPQYDKRYFDAQAKGRLFYAVVSMMLHVTLPLIPLKHRQHLS